MARKGGKKKRIEMKIRLKKVRISFIDALWKPEAIEQGQKPAYSSNFLIPKDDPQAKTVLNGMKKLAQAQWGSNGLAILKDLQKEKRTFLQDGDKKRNDAGDLYDGYPGNWVVSGRSYVKPRVCDRDPDVLLDEEEGKLYSGCFVNAVISLWVQSGGKWGKRINCQLQGVQFHSDGEQFGGGKSADASDFDNLADEFDDEEDEIIDADDLIGDDDIDDDIPF